MFGAQLRNNRLRAAMQLCMSLLVCLPAAAATNLVTGNGFGFAVVREHSATLTSFYAHPYSFTRPDPRNPLSEGIPTANFLKSLSWSGTAVTRVETDYLQDSQIIRASSNGGEGYFFMPWGLNRAALIVAWKHGSQQSIPAASVEWSHAIASQKQARISGQSVEVLKFNGIEESLLLIPIGGQNSDTHFPDSNSSWALISLENDNDLEPALREFARWRGDLDPSSLVERELTDLDRWRVTPSVKFINSEEQHLWRQSEVMLRMAQSREPNRPGRYSHGLIVASLPDGVWFTPWVRDMAYATVAFARMGHQAEARDALLAYFNGRPTGKMRAETKGADYQISVVRYFGDGSEEPFFTMEGSTNIEFDDWGEALWALGQYMRKYDDTALLSTATYRGPLYESARDYIVKPLLANLEPYKDGLIVAADTSIWEEHQKDAKHFAFSTAAAIAGLREFAEIVHRTGDEPTRSLLADRLALLERGFNAAFIATASCAARSSPASRTTSTAHCSSSFA
jgi:hypothetical protein